MTASDVRLVADEGGHAGFEDLSGGVGDDGVPHEVVVVAHADVGQDRGSVRDGHRRPRPRGNG